MYPSVRTQENLRVLPRQPEEQLQEYFMHLFDTKHALPLSVPNNQFHKTNLWLHCHSPVAVHAHGKRSLKRGDHLFKWKCCCTKRQLLARIPNLYQVWNKKGSWPNKWPHVGAKGSHITEESPSL